MRSIYLDCTAGISGDMLLAALLGIGLDIAPFEAILQDMGLAVQIQTFKECRAAGPGYRVEIVADKEQPLRHLEELLALAEKFAQQAAQVKNSGIDAASAVQIANKASQAFTRLAEVEAAAHACPIEDVHFHEVGAVDTVADILGALWALKVLDIQNVQASALPWFGGTVNCEHGCLPLPAPATAQLMQGKPLVPSTALEELITPTGALLLDILVDSFSKAPPAGILLQLSTGYGSRPSLSGLRLLLIEQQEDWKSNEIMHDRIVQLECHLDHLTGEELGDAIPRILDAGALDVLWLPGVGKKNRPSGLLSVLCNCEQTEQISKAIFHYTHSLGVRYSQVERLVIPRTTDGIVKKYTLDGENYSRAESSPQAQKAQQQGRSLVGQRLQINK